MQLSFRFKILVSFIFVIISSLIFYFLSNKQPFQVLYDNGFDKVLNYIIKSETPERIKFFINDLDVYYWNIIVASIFFISIIIIIFNSFTWLLKNKITNLMIFTSID